MLSVLFMVRRIFVYILHKYLVYQINIIAIKNCACHRLLVPKLCPNGQCPLPLASAIRFRGIVPIFGEIYLILGHLVED